MLYLNRQTIRLAILILPTIFTACANRTEVLFVSHPSGATITEISTGTAFGNAPTNRLFNLDAMGSVNEEGCHTISGVEAKWASGAIRQLPEIKLCGRHKLGYTITMIRPRAHPDLEKNLELANDLQADVDQAEKRLTKLLIDDRMLESKRTMNRYGAAVEQSESIAQTRDQSQQ